MFHRWKKVIHVWNDTRVIKWRQNAHFLLNFCLKSFDKYILTDTLPSGRWSLSFSSFLIRSLHLLCWSEVRKINTNLWDDKHHNPATIFITVHYRHCYIDYIPSAQNEPFLFTDATLNFWPDQCNASQTLNLKVH